MTTSYLSDFMTILANNHYIVIGMNIKNKEDSATLELTLLHDGKTNTFRKTYQTNALFTPTINELFHEVELLFGKVTRHG